MLAEIYAGETVRITVKDLTHIVDGPVTAGAIVTIQVFKPDGTQQGTDLTGTVSGDDWYADLTMPATPLGTYTVKATATKGGAVWKGKDAHIRMKGF